MHSLHLITIVCFSRTWRSAGQTQRCSSSSLPWPHNMHISASLGSMAFMRCCRQCPPAAKARRCRWLCSESLPAAVLAQSGLVRLQSMPSDGANFGLLRLSSSMVPLDAASMTTVRYKCSGDLATWMLPNGPQTWISVSMVSPATPNECRSSATGPAALELIFQSLRSWLAAGGRGLCFHEGLFPPTMYSPRFW